MSIQITLGSTVLFNNQTTGAGFSFTAGSLVNEAIEARAPLGAGFWLKQNGTAPATHTLDIHWHTTTPATIRTAIENLSGATKQTLTVPGYGTFPNTRLSAIGDWTYSGTDNNETLLSTSLTFTQYPS